MKSFALLLSTVLLIVAAESDEPDLSVPKEDVKYTAPKLSGNAFLAETFDSGFGSRWVKSEAKKEDSDESIAKYNGEWEVKEADSSSVKGDVGLVLTSKARHAAISAKLDRPFTFSGKPFVVQYEVKFQNGMDCGGAYVKLLSDTPGLDLKQVTDKTGYTIMFGPDACGMDKKMHFIMRHKSPKTGQYEEKHAKKPSGSLDFFSDKKTHLFRLTVRPNNEWEVHLDGAMLNSGGLLEDMTPSINPPAEIDDPSDSRPADWDEREKIPDPTATKPIDWDEDAPEFVLDQDAVKPDGWLDDEEELSADPSAVKPQDWDDEMDGEWEAPKIENPKCKSAPGCGEWKRPNKRNPDFKGKWKADLIDNPNYKGVWKPKRIANPDFFEDKEPYKMTPIGAVAFELWTMTDGVLFDNVLITDDEKVADNWAQDTWYIKRDVELAAAAKDSPSLTSQFWQAMDDKPWLWAALIVAMLVPIGVVVFCCMGSGKDAVAEAKKTDAPTADDSQKEEDQKESAAEDNETAEDQETKEDDGSGDSPAETKKSQSRSTTPSRAGRQALNEPAEDEGENSLDENSKSAAEQSDGEAAVRRSPRKRNVRKD